MVLTLSVCCRQSPLLLLNPGGTPSPAESESPVGRPLLRGIKQTQANTSASEFGDKIVDTGPPIKKYCTTLLPPYFPISGLFNFIFSTMFFYY